MFEDHRDKQKTRIKNKALSTSNIITKLERPVRRRLRKVAQFNRDADYRRRAKGGCKYNCVTAHCGDSEKKC